MKYDVFLSYRRDGGFETAKHLHDLLSRDRYKVSFDIDTLRNGDFDKQLYSRIDECQDFIIVLDVNAFKRTLDPNFPKENDWMRNELAYAIQRNKNIIPVMLGGFNFPDTLPHDISAIRMKNGPAYTKEYFENFYIKLRNFMISKPKRNPLIYASIAMLVVALFIGAASFIFNLHSVDTVNDEAVVENLQSVDDSVVEPQNIFEQIVNSSDSKIESPQKQESVAKFDSEEFKAALNAAMDNVESAKLVAIDKFIKETTRGELPQWVFSKQGDGRYVGVSDPNVTAEKGFEQALIRAWMLFQVAHHVSVSCNEEYYESKSSSGTTFSLKSLQEISSNKTLSVTLTPIKQHISNYGEYFVEFETEERGDYSYTFSSGVDDVILVSKYDESETVSNVDTYKGYVCADIKPSEHGRDTTSYILGFNRKKVYNYKNTVSTLKKDSAGNLEVVGVTSSRNGDFLIPISISEEGAGYWSALLSSLLSNASRRANEHDLSFSGTGDGDQSISKAASREDIQVSLFHADINDNKIYVDWDIEILDN